MPGAVVLVPLALQPHDGRQQLLRGDGAVPGGRGRQAGVAVAARLRVLAEVREQLHPAAGDRLAQREHRVQVRGQPPAVLGVALGGVDHPPLLHDVLQAVGEPRGRRQAVAAGAARLLVVALDGLRQVEVCDEPHVRLVDAHAERDGRDHDEAVLAQEPGLVPGADLAVEARVVRQRGHALGRQELGGLLDGVPRQAVDDPGVAGVLGPDEVEQLLARARLGRDAVLDVRAVERRDELPGVGQLEPLGDLGAGGGRGGRGQGDPGDAGPALVQHRQAQVVRAEVVAPLGHAVRLVDREQADRRPVEQRHGLGHPEPLGRQVEQVELALQQRALHVPALAQVLRRVEEAGPHAERGQGVDLVLHERDQRGHHHAGPGPDEGRHLVAERLAAAGRHEHEGVAAADHGVDDVRLLAAERVVAPDLLQHLERRAAGGRVVRGVRDRAGRGGVAVRGGRAVVGARSGASGAGRSPGGRGPARGVPGVVRRLLGRVVRRLVRQRPLVVPCLRHAVHPSGGHRPSPPVVHSPGEHAGTTSRPSSRPTGRPRSHGVGTAPDRV